MGGLFEKRKLDLSFSTASSHLTDVERENREMKKPKEKKKKRGKRKKKKKRREIEDSCASADENDQQIGNSMHLCNDILRNFPVGQKLIVVPDSVASHL